MRDLSANGALHSVQEIGRANISGHQGFLPPKNADSCFFRHHRFGLHAFGCPRSGPGWTRGRTAKLNHSVVDVLLQLLARSATPIWSSVKNADRPER
jgi:hypothetical protein